MENDAQLSDAIRLRNTARSTRNILLKLLRVLSQGRMSELLARAANAPNLLANTALSFAPGFSSWGTLSASPISRTAAGDSGTVCSAYSHSGD